MNSNDSATSSTRLLPREEEGNSRDQEENSSNERSRSYGTNADERAPATRRRTISYESLSGLNLAFSDTKRSIAAPNRHYVANDEERVYRAAEDAGLSSFGIIGVDVWRLDEKNGQLTHAALWVSPTYIQEHAGNEFIERIINPLHPNHVEPLPQVAGTGLPGYFLALGNIKTQNGGFLWRKIRAITSDPFQAPCERMDVFQEAGFGKASGVAFDIEGYQGVVVYLTRGTADEAMLNEEANARFLRMAAQHIGVASALSKTRQNSIDTKCKRVRANFHRLKTKQQIVQAFSHITDELSEKNAMKEQSTERPELTKDGHSFFHHPSFRSIREKIIVPYIKFQERAYYWTIAKRDQVRDRIVSAAKKSRGGTVQPPPAVPWWNAMWTFLGVLCALSLLVCFSQFASRVFGHGILLAPFGALLTLQFSLTAAPASQPRTILYGQVLCLGIGVCCKYYLLEKLGWPSLFVEALAVALGITSMTKVGIAHPPAAAAMLVVFNQPSTWASLITAGIYIVANILAISVSVAINNLSEQRQYPVYWAMDAGFPKASDILPSGTKTARREECLPFLGSAN